MAIICLALHLPFTATLPDFMHVIEYSHIPSFRSEVTMAADPWEELTHLICAGILGKSADRDGLQVFFYDCHCSDRVSLQVLLSLIRLE